MDSNSTTSSKFLPIIALETGAIYEINPLSISASSSPTILYFTMDDESIFLSFTVEPKTTLFLMSSFVTSIT